MPFYHTIATQHAQGLILAHGLKKGNLRYPKGYALTSNDIMDLQHANVHNVSGFLLDTQSEYSEEDAMQKIHQALAANMPQLQFHPKKGGKCLLSCSYSGLVHVHARRIKAFLARSMPIALSTVTHYCTIKADRPVAILKVIPLGIQKKQVEIVCDWLKNSKPLLKVLPPRFDNVLVLHSYTKDVDDSNGSNGSNDDAIFAKTMHHIDTRLTRAGVQRIEHQRTPHSHHSICAFLHKHLSQHVKLCIIVPPQSEVDAYDTIGSALRDMGATSIAFGIPAEPGHLSLIAKLGATHIVVLPGCARLNSHTNGIDSIITHIVYHASTPTKIIPNLAIGGFYTRNIS